MQVSFETTGALERRIEVSVPRERIEQAIDERLKRVGRTEKPRILPRNNPRAGMARGGGAKGGTRTLTGVTRWNLNPVRLPVPPLSRTPAPGPATGRIL